jgi:TPR repeat protein
MSMPRQWTMALVAALALCVCPEVGSTTTAAADQATTLADAMARDIDPAKISTLIASTAGHVPADATDMAPTLEQLQRVLNVGNGVAVALLHIFDQQNVATDQLIKDLAQSASLYHALADDLAGMNLDDPAEQQMIAQAQAAMSTGRFSDVERQIRQLGDREIALAGQSTNGSGVNTPLASEHQFAAAQALTLLGKIALMKLQYGAATEDFQLARQRLMTASSGPSHERVTDAEPPTPPRQPANEGTAPASKPIVVAMVQPAITSTVPDTAPTSPALPRVTNTVAEPPTAAHVLPADTLELILRRGDELLALGDLAAARLLYERAAAAGDARGAIGMAKTYDPRVLAQIGARGIQPDPDAAATWYRKALSLGDTSAAARLRMLEQRVSSQ